MSDTFDQFDSLEQDSRIDEVPRMATQNQLDPAGRLKCVGNIKRIRREYDLSIAKLAKMAGVSESVVSETLAGKYSGNADEVLIKLEGAMNEHARRKSLRPGDVYVNIKIARDIYKVMKWTSKCESIGVICGVSGIGKTMALEAACRTPDFRTALLVKVDDRSRSRLNFCVALLHAMSGGRMIEADWRVSRTMESIVDRLSGGGRMIVVDEAENLPPETLNIIRQIHDSTQCPVLLVGRPHLNAVIDRTTRIPQIGGSLVGRICIRKMLTPMVRGSGRSGGGNWICSVEELGEKLAYYKVRFAPDAVRYLHKLAHESAYRSDTGREAGGLRLVDKLALLAVGVNRGASVITLQMVRDAHRLMVGPEEAQLLADLVDRALRVADDDSKTATA